jgi:hypothetical protein
LLVSEQNAMPITVREAGASRPPVKRNIASLVGGFVIGIGCFVLWMLVATQLTATPFTPAVVGSGALAALAVGIWIRIADL